MRLLQAIAGAEFGGAEEFFVRLAIAFKSTGLRQRVIIRRNESRAGQLRIGGVEPIELKFGEPLDIITKLEIKRQIAEFQPDIILTWMNRASHIVPSHGKFIRVGRLGGYYNLKYYRGCDHLIANTKDIVSYIKKNGWGDEQVHYLPNFVNDKTEVEIKREEFDTPKDNTLILALGRLHENKAFDVLFESLVKVPDAYLWLAGEGLLRKKLEKQAERIGIKPRVRFLGWRRDKEALFSAADILVCPSRHEPLGNVIIEAWAQGVQVVAADSIGPKSLIMEGQTGMLFPVDDSNALANVINRLIADSELGKRLIEKGKEIYKLEYSQNVVIDKYMKLFKKICS